MGKTRAPFTAAEFETWLTPGDAVTRLGHLKPALAKDAIVRRLRHDQLRASARGLTVTFEDHRTRQGEYMFIPPKAWEIESALWSVWDTTDFSTHMTLGDEVVGASFFGVRFDPAGIEAMIADAPRTVTRESTTALIGKSGRPRKDFWDDLLIEMFRQLWHGDLQPTTQADIEQAMLNWAETRGYELGESTARPIAKKLFAAYRSEAKN